MSGAARFWPDELDAVTAAPKHHRLIPHTLENVGRGVVHVVSVELKDAAPPGGL